MTLPRPVPAYGSRRTLSNPPPRPEDPPSRSRRSPGGPTLPERTVARSRTLATTSSSPYTRPMPTCANCGEDNPERFRFCGGCGNPLVAVDLVGFTARSDQADPEDVRATLRPYHAMLKREIERYGGTVEKFIGDAVMAVFVAPVA